MTLEMRKGFNEAYSDFQNQTIRALTRLCEARNRANNSSQSNWWRYTVLHEAINAHDYAIAEANRLLLSRMDRIIETIEKELKTK